MPEQEFDLRKGQIEIGHIYTNTNHVSGSLQLSCLSRNGGFLIGEDGTKLSYDLYLDLNLFKNSRFLHRGKDLKRPLPLSVVFHDLPITLKPGFYRDE